MICIHRSTAVEISRFVGDIDANKNLTMYSTSRMSTQWVTRKLDCAHGIGDDTPQTGKSWLRDNLHA